MATGDVQGTNVFKVNVHWTIALSKQQTSFHLRDVGFQGQTAQNALDAVTPWVEDHFGTLVPSSGTVDRIEAQEITSKQYAQKEYSNRPGGGSSAEPTSFLAVMVSLRSAVRARYRNGRMFWPLPSSAVVSVNQISSTYVPVYQAVIDDLLDRFTGLNITTALKLCVVGGPLVASASHPAVTHSWIDVESIRLNRMLTSMRRRKVGVGS